MRENADQNNSEYGTTRIITRIKNHSNSRREGVCIYYKQSVALKILYIKYLEESIFSHVLTPNEPCNFISLYRSPSQPTDDIFDQFADNLELS